MSTLPQVLAAVVALALLTSTAKAEPIAEPQGEPDTTAPPPTEEAAAAPEAASNLPAFEPLVLAAAPAAPPAPAPLGPPAAPRSPADADRPAATSRYTDPGLLGPVRLGPTVGAGVPDGLRLGVFAKWLGVLGGGAAFSLLPNTTIPGVNVQVVRASGEAFARVHPFRGAFFLGVAGGYAQTKGTLTEQTTYFRQNQRVVTNAYASAVYVAPQLGFQWMLPLGLTIGCDAGVEIPIATTGPSFDASRYGLVVPIEAKGKVADATRYVTTRPLPVIHLLEVGYAL